MRKELTKGVYKPDPGMYVLEIELSFLDEKIEVKADTGFSSRIFLPESYSKKFDKLNIPFFPSEMEQAGGNIVWGWVYKAYVKRIGEYMCDPIEAFVHCYGNGIPLMGLGLLDRWICEFDGPNSYLTLFSEEKL